MKFLLMIVFGIFTFVSAQAEQPLVLEEDQYLSFARGNKIHFQRGSQIAYYKDGSIQSVFTVKLPKELTEWKTAGDEVFPMMCGPKFGEPLNLGPQSNLIWFHPNGEYFKGCYAVTTYEYYKNSVHLLLGYQSEVELSDQGQLVYLSSIHSGQVNVLQKNIKLKPRTEISFYDSGALKFFTPKKNQQYISDSQYGPIHYGQVEPEVSISLFENGIVERGILAKEMNILGLSFPVGTGLTFSDNEGSVEPFLFSAILKADMTIKTLNKYNIQSKSLRFHKDGYLEALQVSEPFIFIKPETNEELKVEAGDLVFLDANKKIIRINFRVPTN